MKNTGVDFIKTNLEYERTGKWRQAQQAGCIAPIGRCRENYFGEVQGNNCELIPARTFAYSGGNFRDYVMEEYLLEKVVLGTGRK